MTFEEHLQIAVAELTNRVRDTMAGELQDLIRAAAEHARAEEESSLHEARRAWETERAEFVALELERAREDAEHRLADAIATVRAEADQALNTALVRGQAVLMATHMHHELDQDAAHRLVLDAGALRET
jgi:hypothetical protein